MWRERERERKREDQRGSETERINAELQLKKTLPMFHNDQQSVLCVMLDHNQSLVYFNFLGKTGFGVPGKQLVILHCLKFFGTPFHSSR